MPRTPRTPRTPAVLETQEAHAARMGAAVPRPWSAYADLLATLPGYVPDAPEAAADAAEPQIPTDHLSATQTAPTRGVAAVYATPDGRGRYLIDVRPVYHARTGRILCHQTAVLPLQPGSGATHHTALLQTAILLAEWSVRAIALGIPL